MGNGTSALEESTNSLLEFGLACYKSSPAYPHPKKDVAYKTFKVPLNNESSGGKSTRHMYTVLYSHGNTDESKPPMLLIHGYSQSAAQ